MAVPDYYEILGVPNNAKPAEISAAYNRWIGHFKKDTSPPDPRRQSLLDEARDVLLDPARRDAHDRELAEQRAQSANKPRRVPVAAIAGVVLAVLAGGGAWLALRSPAGANAAKATKGKSPEQIQMAMSSAVSPVVALDISGKSSAVGLGVVIDDKVMVAPCRGLAPGAQLMVQTGTRQVGARVSHADEALGLCRLQTETYVGDPVAVNTSTPAAGSRLFAARVGPKGEVALTEVSVNAIVDTPEGKAIRAAVSEPANGAPLVDAYGRVVAVAALDAAGSVVHRLVPSAWLERARPSAPEPRPYQGAPAAQGAGEPAAPGSEGAVTPEMAKRSMEEIPRGSNLQSPGHRQLGERIQKEREKAVREQMKIIEEAEK